MKKGILVTLLIVATIIGYVVIGILLPAGMFKSIQPHFDGTVQKMTLPIAGPEDITIDQQTGTVFISADDRRANMKQPGSTRGGMFVMILTDSLPFLREVSPAHITDFHPHGISLWREPDGRLFLFVINHRQANPAHVVERFEWKNDSLIHLESISNPERMTSPNDLVAVGERAFYVTNDHYYATRGLGRTLEDYLQRSIAFVNYFNGTSFITVADGIAYPNGITLSPDHSKIIVAATTGRKVLVYDRNLSTGALKLNQTIAVDTGVDNIEVDEQGALWIGCHPQLLKFAGHAADEKKFSPSQVLKITPTATGHYTTAEIFLNDGTLYSGSSVAAVYKNTMLIGSVFENSILFCTLTPN